MLLTRSRAASLSTRRSFHCCSPPLSCVCRRACSSGGSGQDATHHLDVADLLKQYGKAPGVLDHRALEQACTAIMACQVRFLFLPLCCFLQYSSLKIHAESCSCRRTASQPCSCWVEGGCILLLDWT